jgi:hypothetical protein
MSDAQELTPNQGKPHIPSIYMLIKHPLTTSSSLPFLLALAVRGYKATLSNDRVSDEAKAHAQEMLDGTDVSAKMDDNGPTGVSAMEVCTACCSSSSIECLS